MSQDRKIEIWMVVNRFLETNLMKIVKCWEIKQDCQVLRNKARLLYKGYAQIEGIDSERTFSLVSKLRAIKMFLEIACFKKFNVYQMDVKIYISQGKHRRRSLYRVAWGICIMRKSRLCLWTKESIILS